MAGICWQIVGFLAETTNMIFLKSRDQIQAETRHRIRRHENRDRCWLLELPVEIRLKILRELLWQSEPLDCTEPAVSATDYNFDEMEFDEHGMEKIPDRKEYRNFSFTPAILRVCHQLCDEGCPILYGENIFNITVLESTVYFLIPKPSHELVDGKFGDLPESLHSRTRKVQISVHSDDEVELIFQKVAEVVNVLDDTPWWSYLILHYLEQDEAPEQDEWGREQSEAMQMFSYLRNRKHVDIEGLSEWEAEQLISVMTSSAPVTNLLKSYVALERYVHACWRAAEQPDIFTAFNLDPALERVRFAAQERDEEFFLEMREECLHELDEIMRYTRDEFLDQDPASLKMKRRMIEETRINEERKIQEATLRTDYKSQV